MGRAPCCDKSSVKKGPWSPEEDAKLKSYIEKHGTGGNWIALPQKIGLKRCGKSCRLRWLNYLRPNIKHGGFSEEEDNFICNLYLSIGSRWSIIAAQLPGRTDNDIKNYWNTRLKKKLLGKQRKNQRTRSVKQEIEREISDNYMALGGINIFPDQFQQQPVATLSTVDPFQEELFYGGNNYFSDGITCQMGLMPCLQPSLDMAATSSSTYCPMNGMIATGFQYHHNFNSGFDGTYYNNPKQVLEGLESFSAGMDRINKSIITATSQESTSFEDDIISSSIVCSPHGVLFNYEISQQAANDIPQVCTFQESRELEMQQRQYCTSMI